MKFQVLRGTKQEIAESLVRLSGDVREAIVFEEEGTTSAARPTEPADIFAEMIPYMVDAVIVDDTREAIYSRMEGE